MLTDFSVCTGCAILTIWLSFAHKRARRPRPNTSTYDRYICCAGRRKRAPLRSRTCLLRPQRTPCPCGEPGRTRRRGITVRSRAHIAHKPRVRRLTNGRGSRRRNRLLNGFYRSPILSLLAPPAPGLLDLRGKIFEKQYRKTRVPQYWYCLQKRVGG